MANRAAVARGLQRTDMSQIAGQTEFDGGLHRDGGAGRGRRGYIAWILIALALAVGVATVTRDAWVPGFQRLMLYAGKSYLKAMQADGVRTSGTSEYLVVLSNDAARKDTLAFIASHPNMSYAGESIYPRTVRVTLKVPVTDAKKALEALPNVDFLIPNSPLLLCH